MLNPTFFPVSSVDDDSGGGESHLPLEASCLFFKRYTAVRHPSRRSFAWNSRAVVLVTLRSNPVPVRTASDGAWCSDGEHRCLMRKSKMDAVRMTI